MQSARCDLSRFSNASFESGIDNPIGAAIGTAGEQAGWQGGDAERHLVVTKGAFSNVLAVGTQVEHDGRCSP